MFLGNFGNSERGESGFRVLQRMEVASFPSNGGSKFLPRPPGKGFRGLASALSEMAARRVRPRPAVTVPSHWAEHHSPGTRRCNITGKWGISTPAGNSFQVCVWDFVWKSGKIICLNISIGHGNPRVCMYQGHFVGCYLETKHRTVEFQTQHSTSKWKFQLLLSDTKGHLVVWLQSQGKLAVEYFAFGNTGPHSKRVRLSPLPALFLFKDVALMNHWAEAGIAAPSVSEREGLSSREET